MLLLIILGCLSSRPIENNGWKEIKPPRPDLQCWTRWSSGSEVCVPSHTSTHGASK